MKRLKKVRAAATVALFVFGGASMLALATAAGMARLWPLVPAVVLGIVAYAAAELADEADKRLQILHDMESGFFR